MRKIMNFILFGAATLSQAACDIDLDFDGDGVHHLSRTEVVFSSGDTHAKEIRTGSRDWWIVEVKTSDGRFAPNYDSPRVDRDDNIFLDAGWLSVERTGGKTLRIEVVPNRSERRRTATVVLRFNGRTEYIRVEQLPERLRE